MNVTQEAINAIEEVARVTLGWPRHRRWESADKDARFNSFPVMAVNKRPLLGVLLKRGIFPSKIDPKEFY
jgi:hypothetical protein